MAGEEKPHPWCTLETSIFIPDSYNSTRLPVITWTKYAKSNFQSYNYSIQS